MLSPIFFARRRSEYQKAFYFGAQYDVALTKDALQDIWQRAQLDDSVVERINQRLLQIRLCKEFGWTLEYVDSLDHLTIAELLGLLDGEAMYLAKQHSKSKR